MTIDASDRIFKISVVGDPHSYFCSSGQKVQQALERERDTAIPVGCRQGGCGVCRIKVISGNFKAGKMSSSHISQEDEEQGIVLCCRIFPRSDLVLERAPRKGSS